LLIFAVGTFIQWNYSNACSVQSSRK
jgi:hypothetical protein